jgi:hypothetical protein
MQERDEQERKRLEERRFVLTTREAENPSKKLPPALERELKEIERLLASGGVVDPLYVSADETLGSLLRAAPARLVGDHAQGFLPSQQSRLPLPPSLTGDERTIAGVYGLLALENQVGPPIVKFGTRGGPTRERFAETVTDALGEYTASKRMFERVLNFLDANSRRKVRAEQSAAVVRTLRIEGISPDDPQIDLRIEEALTQVVGGAGGGGTAALQITIPDLDEHADVTIIADNVNAMKLLYFAAMLDEARMFQVADSLVSLFQSGMLPLGRGRAGGLLYQYWKRSADRISEVERRNLYARCFGFPGGDAMQESANREFNDLWLRFVAGVSSYVRQFTVDDLLRGQRGPLPVAQQHVIKAARDLAANLSLHGFGVAYFAAGELQTQINEVLSLLSEQEVKQAYGARDMWGVIEQVSALELGGARNTVRYRTMATSGAVIVAWLAKHARDLANPATLALLDVQDVLRPTLRPQGTRATEDPSDRDLVDACEQWLAVTGTSETRVDEYTQPIEGPYIPSSPVRIPSMARDMLDAAGVGVQAGVVGNGNGAGTNRLAALRR